jgi:hypothetical protein
MLLGEELPARGDSTWSLIEGDRLAAILAEYRYLLFWIEMTILALAE